MQIRPFDDETESDYEGIVALDTACWPDYPGTVAEKKHQDQSWDKKYLRRRLLVERAGQIVANGTYMEPSWSYRPGKYHVSVQVHPDHRRQGLGDRIYSSIMEHLAPFNPDTLTSQTREDQNSALQFLERRGYRVVMREPVSHLDVPSFDPNPFAARSARVQSAGIEITPLSELREQVDDWQRRLYDLEWELLQDVPVSEPLSRTPFDVWLQRVVENPGFTPDGNMVARDGDRWVGVSGLWRSEADPKKLYTGLTGVSRSHRRLGLATAMKLRAIEFARAYGAALIETDNEENNPMYQINMQLGFEPRPAWLEFENRLREDETVVPAKEETSG